MKPSGFAKFSVLPMMICLVVVLFAPKLHAQSKSVVTTKRYLTLDLLDVRARRGWRPGLCPRRACNGRARVGFRCKGW